MYVCMCVYSVLYREVNCTMAFIESLKCHRLLSGIWVSHGKLKITGLIPSNSLEYVNCSKELVNE